MTHRQRPRVRFLTGGPTWDERQAKQKPGPLKFTKKERRARKPLLEAMDRLRDAVKARDWRAARAARTTAWDEVKKLDPELTREERKKLGEYKERIHLGEARERREGKRA